MKVSNSEMLKLNVFLFLYRKFRYTDLIQMNTVNLYFCMKLLIKIITIFLVLFPVTGISQTLEVKSYRKNSLFLELGGLGPFYSINLDHILSQRESLMLSYRVGVSVLPNSISMPLAINLITGKYKHHGEVTIGGNVYVEEPFSAFGNNPVTDKMMFMGVGGGYRYQKPDGGIFFTIGVTPLLRLDPPSDDFWNIGTKFYLSGHFGIGITI
jgi:hypothetical protein